LFLILMTPPTLDVATLPEDVTVLHAMIRELVATLQSSNREVEQLKHRLQGLLRQRYGSKAEKLSDDQLMLFAKEILESQPAGAVIVPPAEEKKQEVKGYTRRHGRGALPAELPRKRIEYALSEEDRKCPECGTPREEIGEETSEQVDYVPASVMVLEHVRKKYACKCCQGEVVVAEKAAQPIEKGLPGPGMLAQVAVSKYGDHLPLARQEAIWERHGLEISRKTMADWMREIGEYAYPLYKRMAAEVLQSGVIWTDDTPIRVRDEAHPEGVKTGRLWVYAGDEAHPYTVYEYTDSRKRDGPMAFLDGYVGYLQADAYAGYDVIYAPGTVKEVACWAHARRKFYECERSDPARAVAAVALIRKLYEIEKLAAAMSDEARRALRQEKAAPVLKMIGEWLEREKKNVLPKSPIGQAIEYSRSNWLALNRYIEDGRLSIDNNKAERAVKPIAVGRKNWLFAGSDNGGRTGAVLFSLITTAKAHHLDPWRYLRDVLTRLASHPASRIDEFLPDRWKAMHATEPVSGPDPP
jgi:transposase